MMNSRQALAQLALVNFYLSGGPPAGDDKEKQEAKPKRGRKQNGHKSKQETVRNLSPDVEAAESSEEAVC